MNLERWIERAHATALPLRSFARDRSGAGLVEFALTMPILVLMLSGIVQFGMLYATQNDLMNTAREASRRLALGDLSVAQTPGWIRSRLLETSEEVHVDVDPPSEAAGDDMFTVTIALPAASVIAFDPFGLFAGRQIDVQVSVLDEKGG